ncbi:hypothetical protein B0I37DRAFT_110191 [Chaetomium sp. MPI-CAGE-AT-0009]|nr:hypothetical protein B0I37DRAFT_110191 [Chaetomium sp. MPI-CAGE-AT-0009]
MAPFNWKWESISSFFSSPTSPSPSPNDTPSLPSVEFTKQTDLPMPPNSAFGTSAGPSLPSPAESSTSTLAPSERDYSAPNSPYSHHMPSVSTISTASTAASDQKASNHQNQPYMTPADERLEAARRSAAHIVAPDIMSRHFPKPTHQPSLEELLAREPCKRSIGHYVKNYRERKVSPEPQTEAEFAERAREFEETKKKLLADREKLASLVL